MGCEKGYIASCVFGGGMYHKSVYDMDRELCFLLDGREEEQPELLCDLIGGDGEVSDGDLSACFSGNLRISDSLCIRKLLSGRLSSGQGRNRGGRAWNPVLLCSYACSVLYGAETGACEL